MLSVTNKPFMLSVIMLNIIMLNIVMLNVIMQVSWRPVRPMAYAECNLCWVSFMLSVIYGDCHLCWVSQISPLYSVSLCWISLSWMSLCWVSWRPVRPLAYAECHLCWVSFMLGVFNAEWRLWLVSFMLNVIYAGVSQISPLYWVSLCWISLCWVSLCWILLCWVSLCWISLCWMSLFWMSWRPVRPLAYLIVCIRDIWATFRIPWNWEFHLCRGRTKCTNSEDSRIRRRLSLARPEKKLFWILLNIL